MTARSVGYWRVYTDENDLTLIEDLEYVALPMEFAPPAPPVHVTDALDATGIRFLSFPAGWTDLAHPSPARQFCIVLSGEAIFSAGAEERRVGPGTFYLLEDTSGPGHGIVVLTDLVCAIVRL